jgi:hypothetical protein
MPLRPSQVNRDVAHFGDSLPVHPVTKKRQKVKE